MLKWLMGASLILILVGCDQPAPNKQAASENPLKEVENHPETWFDLKMKPIPIPDGTGEPPARNFYLIFDGSGSMKNPTNKGCGGNGQFDTKMKGAVWAIDQFLGQVPDDVNLGLYAFDRNGAGERVGLARNNRGQLRKAIVSLDAGGKTPLADAISFARKQLVAQYQRQLGYGEFRLIVVTDGIAEELPEAAMEAARYGIPIYTIGLCIGKDHPLRAYSVSYQAADDFQELAAGLGETLAELPQYQAQDFDTTNQ